jgi:FKBP-type peptidyl-prolyl cis-trans isomerase (trigger factor)
MDGKPLEEEKGIDVTVEVGSGRFIPTLEEKLIGLKPEDERDVDVSFPWTMDTRSGPKDHQLSCEGQGDQRKNTPFPG